MSHDEKLIESIRRRLDRPLVLIGLMGAGKSRLGRMLGDALDLPFTDSDDEIEKAAGMSVSDIFARFGEPYFRDGEHRVIKRLLEAGVGVIATGGGAIMRPETAEIVWRDALSVWVRAELPVMLERTSRNDKRPLLRQGNPEEILRGLMEKRYPVYQKANIIVDSHSGPPEDILSAALKSIHDYLWNEAAT